MRNIMGSWPFVFSFFAVMILWAGGNTYFLQRVIHHKAFDPYPYILLNLFLSMLAGVQAAALLIAAKRDRLHRLGDRLAHREEHRRHQGVAR